jgi:hypothetical protein
MNTGRRDQQGTERRHIEAFLAQLGIEAAVEYGDAPDAVLLIEGRRVGLEHRELYEEDLAANKANIEWLEHALRAELARLGLGEDFWVGVGWSAAAPLFRKRSHVDDLARRIARLAHEHVSRVEAGGSLAINAPALARVHHLPDLLHVTVVRHEHLRGGPRADVSPAFWGPVESSVVAAVQDKERRLARYKAAGALDACWLLLVTGDSWAQATDSALTESLQIASAFDAVYLMDLRTGQLQRVDAYEAARR